MKQSNNKLKIIKSETCKSKQPYGVTHLVYCLVGTKGE